MNDYKFYTLNNGDLVAVAFVCFDAHVINSDCTFDIIPKSQLGALTPVLDVKAHHQYTVTLQNHIDAREAAIWKAAGKSI